MKVELKPNNFARIDKVNKEDKYIRCYNIDDNWCDEYTCEGCKLNTIECMILKDQLNIKYDLIDRLKEYIKLK